MIFATEAGEEARRRIARDLASGVIADEEGCRQLLELDPDDASALGFFAECALENGDLAGAAHYAQRIVLARPLGHEGYLLLARTLHPTDPPLAVAFCHAALERLRLDDGAVASADLTVFTSIVGKESLIYGLLKKDAIARLLEHLGPLRDSEPEHVVEELEPHRLVLELFGASEVLLHPSEVDAILSRGAACMPLLLGVLKEWGAGLLADADRPLAERALALLGEIGDPAALPAIAEFLLDRGDDLSGPADWAFQRIAFQHPEAALETIRSMIPRSPGALRFALAEQIGGMPEVPGRTDALHALTDGIDDLPEDEQEAVVVAAIAGVMLMEGGTSPAASALQKRFAALITAKGRSDLRKLRQETLAQGPLAPQPSEYTIYQICCEEPAEDNVAPATVVHQHPRPGRNDPCWCGSGRKYKKCHLELDERRPGC